MKNESTKENNTLCPTPTEQDLERALKEALECLDKALASTTPQGMVSEDEVLLILNSAYDNAKSWDEWDAEATTATPYRIGAMREAYRALLSAGYRITKKGGV